MGTYYGVRGYADGSSTYPFGSPVQAMNIGATNESN